MNYISFNTLGFTNEKLIMGYSDLPSPAVPANRRHVWVFPTGQRLIIEQSVSDTVHIS